VDSCLRAEGLKGARPLKGSNGWTPVFGQGNKLDKNQERNKGLGKKQRIRVGDLVKNKKEDEDKALRESRHRMRKSAFGFPGQITPASYPQTGVL
jgi:hypothetical protein